jgi:methionyl aminopeptidase
MITIKTAEEIQAMRETGQILGQILQEMSTLAEPGMSTGHLDAFAERRCRELNVTPAFKGYRNFPKSVCISVNNESIHGIPSDTKILKEGDLLKLDFGVIKNGWYGDSAVTIGVGEISLENKQLLLVTKECLIRGINKCKIGMTLGDIGNAVQGWAESFGFGVVTTYCGHGIGKSLHEAPNVLNYGKRNTGLVLEEGMVLAIEPMINIGSPEVTVAEDGWTVITKDGSNSAHFEHTVAITKNGPEILTAYKE